MTKSKGISEQERELFINAIGTIKPIKHNDIYVSEKPKHRARIKKDTTQLPPDAAYIEQDITQLPADKTYIAEVDGKTPLCFRKPGVKQKDIQKLYRAKIPANAELDLHGVTAKAVKEKLHHFIVASQSKGYRHIRIIHGKGYGSSTKTPKLKNILNRYLQNHDLTLAFRSPSTYNGGTGAIHVLIKRQ